MVKVSSPLSLEHLYHVPTYTIADTAPLSPYSFTHSENVGTRTHLPDKKRTKRVFTPHSTA
ncbi:MAG UNVERIFIED_CONTAM: hypothetical protein LVR29_07900 [Microcystis novacekii LVE1205-3]